jgi:hypothetical protein
MHVISARTDPAEKHPEFVIHVINIIDLAVTFST